MSTAKEHQRAFVLDVIQSAIDTCTKEVGLNETLDLTCKAVVSVLEAIAPEDVSGLLCKIRIMSSLGEYRVEVHRRANGTESLNLPGRTGPVGSG